jgi:hypothetical protein
MNDERKPEKVSAPENSRRGISRREFARRAAIASAVASWAPINAANAGIPVPATQAPQPPSLPSLTPESQAEVDARVHAILSQYGSRLSEDQKTDIRRLCTMAQPPLDRLRAYNIENAVSPALYLKPLVEREKKPATKPPSPTAVKPPDVAKKP